MEIYLKAPKGFIPDLTVVGCYCQCQDTFLLLKRHPKCWGGGLWGLPGGKLEAGESRLEGAKRELYEEVGIELIPTDLSHIVTFYIDRGLKYDFAVYACHFKEPPSLKIHLREHTEGRWVTHEEAQALPLLPSGLEILRTCLQKSR